MTAWWGTRVVAPPVFKTVFNLTVQEAEYGYPDNKVYGANMGPTWGWQDPGGPHVGPMNFVIWVVEW